MRRLILMFLMLGLLTPLLSADEPSPFKGTVKVDGLSCPFCAHGLNKKVSQLNWINEVTIYVDEGRANFTVKAGLSPDIIALQRAVKDGGFTPQEISLSVQGKIQQRESEVLLVLPSGVTLTIDPSKKRNELLESLSDKSKTVYIEGLAKAKHNKTHILITTYRIL